MQLHSSHISYSINMCALSHNVLLWWNSSVNEVTGYGLGDRFQLHSEAKILYLITTSSLILELAQPPIQ